MTAPAEAMPHPVAASEMARGISKINSATGLSTDYLNHFTEAIMVLEMGTTMPDCLEDLRAWRPKTYCEHFATSRFHDRDAVIAAYNAVDPAVRDALDAAAETLNAVLVETRDVVLGHLTSPNAEALARYALAWLKPLLARTAAVINGSSGYGRAVEPQAAVDALFSR